jgi:GDP-D-mannose dehydratase
MVEAAANCGADSVKSKNYALRTSSRTAPSCIPTYFQSYGLPIMRTRAFNHEGPRRGDVFVTSNFAKQVAEVETELREPVAYVGDLKPPRRDYSDVRDIVRGYWTLLERGESPARSTTCARGGRGSSRRSWTSICSNRG